MAMKYKSCRSLCSQDSIFDDVKNNYSDFDQWFKKCYDLSRTVVVVDPNSAIAILKYKSNSIKICTFVVRINYRKQGIGSSLMDELIKHATDLNKNELYVSVLNTNVKFINFCQHFGFKMQSNDGINIIFSYKI